MDEREEVRHTRTSPEDVERYLGVVLGELEGLPSLAQTWDLPEHSTDDVDSYNSWWESIAGARMDRLEAAYRAGRMSPNQERRYAEAKRLFAERMPLIERYGLDAPGVPLD